MYKYITALLFREPEAAQPQPPPADPWDDIFRNVIPRNDVQPPFQPYPFYQPIQRPQLQRPPINLNASLPVYLNPRQQFHYHPHQQFFYNQRPPF